MEGVFMSKKTIMEELALRIGNHTNISSNSLEINSENTQKYIYELPEAYFCVLLKAIKAYQEENRVPIFDFFKNRNIVSIENKMTDAECEKWAGDLYGALEFEFLTPYHVVAKQNVDLMKLEIPFFIKKALILVLFHINILDLSNEEWGALFDWFRIDCLLCDCT
jgi:hypothetical protein